MAFPLPPAHLPGAQPSYQKTKKAFVKRLHNRRLMVARLANGNCYVHFSVALQLGEAARLRREGHVDCATDYILRDRVHYWVLILAGETMDALVSCWGQLQELNKQRQQQKRV